ncbi:MOSC domain-containing protein [Chondromyces crocatus]|uniref:MOSC domain-containing protein n=1 Tax=Chondromyces crocatus TaxID=52 RepID=A0A0K1E5V5_CHOCO|nr:MOSC N-terminal beta barrel domain-containing protein [Chondromyces crocatus]AKT35958.1 uncharacterized protein CMC5_000700 [Chondromyces crocatus]
MDEVRISGLHIYPLKSGRGLAVAEAEVGDRGFVDDRRFMVVDERGRLMSQREQPRMALIEVTIRGEGLVLSAPGVGGVEVSLRPREGVPRRVQVWADDCDAIAVSPEADAWLQRHLGVSCALVYMPDASFRAVDPDHSAPGDQVSFADGFPFLLASRASLEDLNARLAQGGATPVSMDRFRPNLVVEGCAPYAEDRWRELEIGGVLFEVTKPCARCVMVTVDPARGVTGREPLATLATYRKHDGEVMFGQNLVHRRRGVIRVGDRVRLLDARDTGRA